MACGFRIGLTTSARNTMNEPVTTETIIGFLKDCVEQKIPVAPSMFLDSAFKLNLLLGDEIDELLELEQKVAMLRTKYILEGDTVAKSKAKVEASDYYRMARKQKARIDQINEHIRISKIQARMRLDELRGN